MYRVERLEGLKFKFPRDGVREVQSVYGGLSERN